MAEATGKTTKTTISSGEGGTIEATATTIGETTTATRRTKSISNDPRTTRLTKERSVTSSKIISKKVTIEARIAKTDRARISNGKEARTHT